MTNNILNNLEEYFENKNILPVLARVQTVDFSSRTLDCVDITQSKKFVNVRVSAAGSLADSVNIPNVGAFVILGFFDEDNAFVITSSNSSSYVVKTTDDNGDLKADLKETLDELQVGLVDYNDSFKDLKSDLSEYFEDYNDDINGMSWVVNGVCAAPGSPLTSGLTSGKPLNTADLATTVENINTKLAQFGQQLDYFEDVLVTFKENVDKLFSS